MNRSAGLIALLLLSALALVAVLGVTSPIRVEAGGASEPAAAAALAATDAGSVDSLLDAVHLEHVIKHGR